MTCRSCGATIADKAIVCYRCGTPTALPAELSARAKAGRPPAGRPPRGLAWIVVAVAIVAAAFWFIPRTTEGSLVRWVAWGVVVGVVLAAVQQFARRRR